MRSRGSHASDQRAVLKNIAAKAFHLKVASPTEAMSAIYERHASSVEEFARAFTCEERQCGVAFAIGGRLLGLDLFDHPEVMRRFFQKLVRSYALDALDAVLKADEPASVETMAGFVGRNRAAPRFCGPGFGLGENVLVNGARKSGSGPW